MAAPDARANAQLKGPTHVLVGRTREQGLLRDELAKAIGGDGRLCLIGGEAGIGKTTLARDLARHASDLGVRVLTGSCHDLASIPPYGPWLDLFEACRRDATLPAPPADFAGGQLAPIADQAALFADVRRFVAELASDRPALIVLEDVHWADPASLDLLRHLGAHLRHWPVLALVTYRADELTPGQPFTQHLPALVREAQGRRFDLHRLDAGAMRTLLVARYQLARADEDRLLAYLERHGEGNPFFVTEILRTLEGDGVFDAGEGVQLLAALDRVVVPTLLRQVIDGRVVRLGGAMRRPLSIAAVIGQEASLDLWAEVAGLTEGETVDIVERAVEAHLLEAARDGTRVRFVHALTREALYEGILPPRRRIWHRQVAEALMEADHPEPDTVAFHLHRAVDPRAAEWLIRAGERSQRAYAWLTAAERYRAAAALLDGIEGQEHVRRWLLIRIFYRLRFAYPAVGLGAIDEAARLARAADDAFMAADATTLHGLLLCYLDQFHTGLAEMERGIAAIEALPPRVQQTANTLRVWLSQDFAGQRDDAPAADAAALDRLNAARYDHRRSYFSWFLATGGHLRAAAAMAGRLAAIFPIQHETRGGIRLAIAFANHTLAIVATAHGQPGEARRRWALAREGFAEVDHHVLIVFSLLDELRDAALTYGAGDPSWRRELASAAAATLGQAGGALRPGVSPRLAWLPCLVLDGRWEEARQVLDDHPPPGNAFLRRELTAARLVLARAEGRPDLAWAHIQPLLPQGPSTPPGNLIHQEGLFLQRFAADLCLDAGDLPGAHAWLAAHDRWLAWSGSVLGQAAGQVGWGWLHQVAGDAASARSHLAQALSLAASAPQPLVRLEAHRLLGEIDLAARRVNDAQSHLDTALALAATCEAPFERSLVLMGLAEARAAAGAMEAAAAVLQEARDTFSTLGATPALARADALATRISGRPAVAANPGGLTARELDVLRLVADGRSNAEIAAALFISRETARTHVSNIFRKLDVGARAEAVDQGHRLGLLTIPQDT